MLLDYPHANYMDEKSLEEAILSYKKMTESQKKILLKFVHQVDRKMNLSGAKHRNLFHKLPTILAGTIYIANYEQTIEKLSMDELIVLSKYSIVEPPEFYSTALEHFGKELLNVITQKHHDYIFQNAFLNYAESKIKDGYTKEQTSDYIRDMPLDKLKEETFKYERTKNDCSCKYSY